ncbi:MAG: 3-keto-5-aminohexanoate cleavage protein [Verrucomicrobia bacterium]|nr:3-keto-5-aminohexanoate cleavage protein [Verrucomicrobiota bacterium]MBV8483001.1 3-keto-5-aminohexanoate cleavage protein [Verrucomicrobiota bacterium]
MIVQACLNGGKRSADHPAVPTTIQALVADGLKVLSVGASELHLHVRNASGIESLAPDDVDATIKALREALPGTLIGISTGAWIEKDDDRTLTYVSRWSMPPDYASVNLREKNAPAVMETLHRRGIGIEAGIAEKQDAERLLRLGLDRLSLRILVEVGEHDIDRAHAVTDEIMGVLRGAPFPRPILLHGDDASAWPLLRRAFESGFSTRIGFEDVKVLPDGSAAASNSDLVAAAVRILKETGLRGRSPSA